MRDKTRKQRYDEKKLNAKAYPISIATVNFMHDGNLGYLIRSAACFGAECVHVIGTVPDRSVLNPLSGSLFVRFSTAASYTSSPSPCFLIVAPSCTYSGLY